MKKTMFLISLASLAVIFLVASTQLKLEFNGDTFTASGGFIAHKFKTNGGSIYITPIFTDADNIQERANTEIKRIEKTLPDVVNLRVIDASSGTYDYGARHHDEYTYVTTTNQANTLYKVEYRQFRKHTDKGRGVVPRYDRSIASRLSSISPQVTGTLGGLTFNQVNLIAVTSVVLFLASITYWLLLFVRRLFIGGIKLEGVEHPRKKKHKHFTLSYMVVMKSLPAAFVLAIIVYIGLAFLLHQGPSTRLHGEAFIIGAIPAVLFFFVYLYSAKKKFYQRVLLSLEMTYLAVTRGVEHVDYYNYTGMGGISVDVKKKEFTVINLNNSDRPYSFPLEAVKSFYIYTPGLSLQDTEVTSVTYNASTGQVMHSNTGRTLKSMSNDAKENYERIRNAAKETGIHLEIDDIKQPHIIVPMEYEDARYWKLLIEKLIDGSLPECLEPELVPELAK